MNGAHDILSTLNFLPDIITGLRNNTVDYSKVYGFTSEEIDFLKGLPGSSRDFASPLLTGIIQKISSHQNNKEKEGLEY